MDGAEARRRKLMMLCKEVFGDDDEARRERLELACYLLRRDITTYKGLDDAQVSRLLDAVEGYQLIDVLLSLRPRTTSVEP